MNTWSTILILYRGNYWKLVRKFHIDKSAKIYMHIENVKRSEFKILTTPTINYMQKAYILQIQRNLRNWKTLKDIPTPC